MESLERLKEDIIEKLDNGSESSPIILVGDPVIGETNIVKEISEQKNYETLWIHMTQKYDPDLFYRDIAKQYLYLSSCIEEWEDKDQENEQKRISGSDLKEVQIIRWGHRQEEEKVDDDLDRRILEEKLKDISQALFMENKCLLLVLHNEGDNLIDDEIYKRLPEQWISMFPTKFRYLLRTIIATKHLDGSNAAQTCQVIKLELLLEEEESSSLLRRSVDRKVSENSKFRQLQQAIAGKSDGKPSAIIVIAKALNYIAHDVSKLESAILKLADCKKTSEEVNPLVCSAVELIEKGVTKDCFLYSIELFRNYSGINFNELITYWIMEGYFDPFDQVEKAYWQGYDVLTELIDRALLKIQENSIVTVEREAINITHSCAPGLNVPTAALRLSSVLNKAERLGKVTQMNGMIKTLCNPKFWEKNSVLLMDDNHLSEEVHHTFLKLMKELKVLAVFKGMCDSLPSLMSGLEKLLVLVFRSCDLPDNIADIKKLTALKVLEISCDESTSISIPDNLLDKMAHLESLNLSGLVLKSLPSFAKPSKLRILILRRLSHLEEAESLKELDKLEILDISGSSSLKSLPNNLFSKLGELHELILSKCSSLKKLQSLQGLGKLQLLDLSDATSFESFDDLTLSAIPEIRKIDLTNTRIEALPELHELKCLKQLMLRGCCDLLNIPKLQLLRSLQVLDLNGAVKFCEFGDESLEMLDQLRILDLSGTGVTKLSAVRTNLVEFYGPNTQSSAQN